MMISEEPDASKSNLFLSRRAMLGSGVLLSLAACEAETGVSSARDLDPASSGGKTESSAAGNIPANFRAPGNKTHSPQVVYGPTSAKRYTELALSLHCGASRDYLRGPFRQRVAEARAGQRMLIITHYVRTQNEIPLGETLLRRGPKYPDAMMAVMGLTAAMGRAISAKEADAFLNDASYPAVSSIKPADARLALGAVRMVYDAAGLTATPFIREGSNQ